MKLCLNACLIYLRIVEMNQIFFYESNYPVDRTDSFSNQTANSVQLSNGAFPLHGTVRFGTARYGPVRLSSGRLHFHRSLVPL